MKAWITKQFNQWVLLGALLVFIFLCAFSGGLFLYMRPTEKADSMPTALVKIIPPPSSTPPVASIGTPTASPEPSVGEGLKIGVVVKVFDTGAAGLRVRSGPGINQGVNFLARDDELFVIKDGPTDADGYQWWQLAAPYDPNRNGWAAANYLAVTNSQ